MGTTVVEATMVEVLRLVEFSKEIVCTEVVKMVEVVSLCVDVVLADLIGLAEVAKLLVVLQGISEVVVVLRVLLGDTGELLVVLQGTS